MAFFELIKSIGESFGLLVKPTGARGTAGYTPDPTMSPILPGLDNAAPVQLDGDGNVAIRGDVLTDEGSFRDDFIGSLDASLTGIATFVSGSALVTGSGTLFTTEVNRDCLIRLDADGVDKYTSVMRIVSDTELELSEGYLGSSGSGAYSHSHWQQIISGGATITTPNPSEVVLNTGATPGATVSLLRQGDYGPIMILGRLKISQRITNQLIYFGFNDVSGGEKCAVGFSGTDSSKVSFTTSSSAASADTEITEVTLPQGLTSVDYHRYEVSMSSEECVLYLDRTKLAVHKIHIPSPYAALQVGMFAVNTGVVTATTMTLDVFGIYNTNRIDMTTRFSNDPMTPPDKFTTGSIITNGGTVVSDVAGYKSSAIVLSGTWTGTVVCEVSSDNGTSWVPITVRGPTTTLAGGGPGFPTFYSNIIANGTYKPNESAGLTHIRMRATTAVTGTINVAMVFTDSASRFLFTSSEVVQNVQVSQFNNSTANLAGGASFTGTRETTLGVSAIQVNFIASQVCRVQVQQSVDNDPAHWDISDQFSTVPGVGVGQTFQATAPYFRVVVTNVTGTPTTYLRLLTTLCPIGGTLPRSLSVDGNLKVSVEESSVVSRDYVVNSQFFNSYLDEYEWYRVSTNGGTVTPSAAYVSIITTTNSASTGYLYTKARSIFSINPKLGSEITLAFDNPTGLANNQRRWGLLANGSLETDGACFELKDGILYATAIVNGTPTRVSVDGFKSSDGLNHEYIIEVSGDEILWNVDDVTVYRVTGPTVVPAFYKRDFSTQFSNVNTGAVTGTAYLRVTAATLYDNVVSAVRLQGDEGNQTRVSVDGFLWTKAYGTVIFSELFPSSTLDTTNKWTEEIVSGGSKSLAGTILSLVVTTANGASITEMSRQTVLMATGQSMNRILVTLNLGLVFDANNRREWGTKTGTNGFFFRQSGTSTYAVALNNGSESTFLLPLLTDGRAHSFEIVRTGTTDVWFYVDRERVAAFHGVSSALIGSKYDTAYLANFNVGVTANPITMAISSIALVEDSNQSFGIIGTDQFGLRRDVAVDENGSLRVTGIGSTGPTTPEAGETLARRAYQTTYEYDMTSAAVEYPIIYIRNPALSGRHVCIRSIFFTCLSGAGKNAILRLYTGPTVSVVGATLTPTTMYVGSGASSPLVLVTTVPTVSANGTKITVAASTSEQAIIDYNYGLVIDSGADLLITGRGSGNGTALTINIIWTEINE